MRVQVYTFIMQELVKYRGMYTSMAELLKSGTPGPDLHAHHDLLASALPPGSGSQVWHLCRLEGIAVACRVTCLAPSSGGQLDRALFVLVKWSGSQTHVSSGPFPASCGMQMLMR